MIALDDFAELQRRVERAKRDRDQAVGARKQLLERLRKEYGCDTLEAAEKHLLKKEAKERQLAEDYGKARKAFDKQYGPALEG